MNLNMKTIDKIIAILVLIGVIAYNSYGAYNNSDSNGLSQVHDVINAATSNDESFFEEDDDQNYISENVSENTTSNNQDVITQIDTSVITLDRIQPYSGEPYVYINSNIPYFTDEEKSVTESFETYSELDNLGRTGVAYGLFSNDMMPTEERGNISNIYPSGWNQAEYDIVDQNWLYNRCHLIAFSVGGNDDERNLITGTRYMNIEGMWAIEETVYYAIKENPNLHVLYRVTPMYEGNNLVASGVLMEAYSIEDNVQTVCFNVFCYNVQPGININYATGASKLAN